MAQSRGIISSVKPTISASTTITESQSYPRQQYPGSYESDLRDDDDESDYHNGYGEDDEEQHEIQEEDGDENFEESEDQET